MDHIRILRRALEITWVYRALWVFGFILALTAPGGGGGNGGGGGGGGGSSMIGTRAWEMLQDSVSTLHASVPAGAAMFWAPPVQDLGQGELFILVLVGLAALLLGIAFTVARYVAETAAIRMVNEYEDTGRRMSVGEGFRVGWSRAALRIFLMDLLLTLGAVLVITVLLLVAFAPMLVAMTNNDTLTALGTALTVVMVMLVVFLIILIVTALTVLMQFFHRAAALENRGVFESMRRGWAVVRARLGDILIMALILFGLSLASVIIFLPVVFILLMLGGVLGGVPGLLFGMLASLFTDPNTSVMIGLLVGLPVFLLVLVLPLLFIGGLVQVFGSSVWTLTYREAVALEVVNQ